MNEKIYKLAVDVGIIIEEDGYFWIQSVNELEEFAQLIVEECVAICQDIDGEDSFDGRCARQNCSVEIREHFGVEE
jgi:hypothetical protein